MPILRLKATKNDGKYVSLHKKGLLHWYWWVFSCVGISKDVSMQRRKILPNINMHAHVLWYPNAGKYSPILICMLTSFDILTQENTHQYQCMHAHVLWYPNVGKYSPISIYMLTPFDIPTQENTNQYQYACSCPLISQRRQILTNINMHVHVLWYPNAGKYSPISICMLTSFDIPAQANTHQYQYACSRPLISQRRQILTNINMHAHVIWYPSAGKYSPISLCMLTSFYIPTQANTHQYQYACSRPLISQRRQILTNINMHAHVIWYPSAGKYSPISICMLTSFDIPTQENTHQYQYACSRHLISQRRQILTNINMHAHVLWYPNAGKYSPISICMFTSFDIPTQANTHQYQYACSRPLISQRRKILTNINSCMLTSFDIPAQESTHQYQYACSHPLISQRRKILTNINACMLTSFDIPAQESTHQYQYACSHPLISQRRKILTNMNMHAHVLWYPNAGKYSPISMHACLRPLISQRRKILTNISGIMFYYNFKNHRIKWVSSCDWRLHIWWLTANLQPNV